MSKIKLGDIVSDIVTGFEGVVTAYSVQTSNCDRIAIQPRDLKDDGALKDALWFDIPQIKFIKESDVPVIKAKDPIFELRSIVKHTLTPYTGTVVSIATWINGCIRYGVQANALHKGIPVSDGWFAESDLVLVETFKETEVTRTGGPMPAPRRASNPR